MVLHLDLNNLPMKLHRGQGNSALRKTKQVAIPVLLSLNKGCDNMIGVQIQQITLPQVIQAVQGR